MILWNKWMMYVICMSHDVINLNIAVKINYVFYGFTLKKFWDKENHPFLNLMKQAPYILWPKTLITRPKDITHSLSDTINGMCQ